MSYTHYHTEALVIALENQGEGNRVITLLTKDYGVIRALAQSVRETRSNNDLDYNSFHIVK